jgi:hypothetical protein
VGLVQDEYEWLWLYAAVEPTTGTGVFLPAFERGKPMPAALSAASASRAGKGAHWGRDG